MIGCGGTRIVLCPLPNSNSGIDVYAHPISHNGVCIYSPMSYPEANWPLGSQWTLISCSIYSIIYVKTWWARNQGSPVSSKAGKNTFFSHGFSAWKKQFLPVSSAEIRKKLKTGLIEPHFAVVKEILQATHMRTEYWSCWSSSWPSKPKASSV